MFQSCNNYEKVVEVLLVPKLAASRTANCCGINGSIQLIYMRYLANHVSKYSRGIQDFLAVPQYSPNKLIFTVVGPQFTIVLAVASIGFLINSFF
jgi:hypothetical protein